MWEAGGGEEEEEEAWCGVSCSCSSVPDPRLRAAGAKGGEKQRRGSSGEAAAGTASCMEACMGGRAPVVRR